MELPPDLSPLTYSQCAEGLEHPSWKVALRLCEGFCGIASTWRRGAVASTVQRYSMAVQGRSSRSTPTRCSRLIAVANSRLSLGGVCV